MTQSEVDCHSSEVHAADMTTPRLLPVRIIVSESYIQSKTWIFATEQDSRLFKSAVAAIPDLDWAAREKDVPPISRRLAKSAGLPAGNGFGTALGIHSKYRLMRNFSGDYGQVVLACVLAMSNQEHPIIAMRDTETGARITSYLPMNRWTWPGVLSLDVNANDEQRMSVEGTAMIRGQLFDWFRCRRAVNQVLSETHKYSVAMGAVAS